MSDILIEFARADQAKAYVGATNSEHNPLIGDALPGYFHCNVRLTLQAANDAPNIIGREACSSGGRMTKALDLYCYRPVVHYFITIFHPASRSHVPKSPSGVVTVNSLRPICRATKSMP